jgi:DNA repair protein RadC
MFPMDMQSSILIEVWELLKAFVLEHAVSMTRRLEDQREADWRNLSTSETQVLAILASLDLDFSSAGDRRRARRLLASLAAEAEGELLVAEEDNTLVVESAKAEQLRKTLRWIAENPPQRFLSGVSGPRVAIREIYRGAPSLGQLHAHKWLIAMGYPCGRPDSLRRRWLVRMGLMELNNVAPASRVREETLATMERLAQAVQTPLAEVDLLLAAFTDASETDFRHSALCTRIPRCQLCPLRNHCAFFREGRQKDESQQRHLSKMMRKESQPRERLEEHGARALSNEELLAILLRTGSGGANVMDVATKLLKDAGGLEGIARMTIGELSAQKGIGRVKAITIKAALELARRRDTTPSTERQPLTSSKTIYRYVASRYEGKTEEEFEVIPLDVKLRPINTINISRGTITQTLVHPREAFKQAIRESAHSVIFVHNHPTGDPAPSREDFIITRRLVQAGEVLGIRVLDHMIIGKGCYYSFSDEGKLES